MLLVGSEKLSAEWQLVAEPMNRNAFEALKAIWALPYVGDPPFDFRVEEEE